MKHQKPLIVRIVIWICVIFMTISLIWVYVVYMFSPNQEAGEDTSVNTWDLQVITWDVQIEEILPEVSPDEPENTEAPILMATEDGEIDEMDLTREVQLENWEVEIVREWDLWDAIQINQ